MNSIPTILLIFSVMLNALVGCGLINTLWGDRSYIILAISISANAVTAMVSSILIMRNINTPQTKLLDVHQAIDQSIITTTPLLAMGLPKYRDPIDQSHRTGFDIVKKSVANRFSTLYFWIFIFTGGSMIIFSDGRSYSTHGVFSILTRSEVGKAFASSMVSYLNIWSLTFFFIGLFFSKFISESTIKGAE